MTPEGCAGCAAAADHSAPLHIPFMVGVYLGVNAIRDAWLLVEGPDCTYLKTEFVQGNHDLNASLTSVSGYHRVTNTALHPAQMGASREEAITSRLEAMARHGTAGLLLLTSMPMAFITGVDYDRLCRGIAERHGVTTLNIPGRSLSGDWLSGYAETLKALARGLPLSAGRAVKGRVGLVGLLFDRNEQDCVGNVRELRRMIEGIGLSVSAVWLSGRSAAELLTIEESEFIVSLPYGREAAAIVARRLGVPLIEAGLPFGLQASERWLAAVAAHAGRGEHARTFIDRELAGIAPRLEWALPFIFQHKRYGYIGDPVLATGFRETVELLGGTLRFAATVNLSRHAPDLPAALGLPPERVLQNPTQNSLSGFLDQAGIEQIDLLLSSYVETNLFNRTCLLEFGFPSYFTHALYDRPYLGFNGFLAFADSLMNRLRQHEIASWEPDRQGPRETG